MTLDQAREVSLVDDFKAAGGRVTFGAGTYTANAHGQRATCTAGAYQAVRRWMERAVAGEE